MFAWLFSSSRSSSSDKERLPLMATSTTDDDTASCESQSSSALYSRRDLPTSLAHSLLHIPFERQCDEFDCGLACASMVLGAIGKPTPPVQLARQTRLRSIWTIDICYLLKDHVSDMTYFTSYIGINFANANAHHIYSSTLNQDKKRIHRRFANAKSAGIRVIPLTLSMDDLIRFLWCKQEVPEPISSSQSTPSPRKLSPVGKKGRQIDLVPGIVNPYVCIILLNAALLDCVWCRSGQPANILPPWCCFWTPSSSSAMMQALYKDEFIGHYILLVGYDDKRDLFYYRDPGAIDEICAVKSEVLQKARSSVGTDDDVLVIRVSD
ncbi:MAG: hypothetical protein SGCHY_000960 [Lobulomycetales sp.]